MIVYISGKYSGDIDKNIAEARRVAIELWEKGFAVICPHLNTAHFEIDCKAKYEDYIKGDIEILSRCDALVVLKDWEDSRGSLKEITAAMRNRMPVYFYPDLPKQ